MKKIIYILGILFSQNLSFGYSAVIDPFYNQEISITDTTQSEIKKEDCSLNYSDYIVSMNILVTVAVAIFAFFIALNIFKSNENLKEAKQELSNLKSEYEKLKGAKDSIINDLKKDGEKLFNEYIIKFKTKAIMQEINTLLLQKKPDKKDVFSKLSSIVECIDIENVHILTKCTDAFPNDQDIARLAIRVLSNIAKEPISPEA